MLILYYKQNKETCFYPDIEMAIRELDLCNFWEYLFYHSLLINKVHGNYTKDNKSFPISGPTRRRFRGLDPSNQVCTKKGQRYLRMSGKIEYILLVLNCNVINMAVIL